MQPAATTAEPPARVPFYRQLYVQVLVAIALGIAVGAIWPATGAALKPLGDAFIKLVKMVISPVIFLTVVNGIARVRDVGSVGRVAIKALGYFITVSTLALIVGLVVANTVRPGDGLHIDVASLDGAAVAEYAAKTHDMTVVGFLTNIIPTTLVSALADGEILQVLFVAILTGIALTLTGELAAPLARVFEAGEALVFRLVGILMRAAPVGARSGRWPSPSANTASARWSISPRLVGTFYLTSLLFVIVVLGAIRHGDGVSRFSS